MDRRTAIGTLAASVMTLGGASIIGATAVGGESVYFSRLFGTGVVALVLGMATLVYLASRPAKPKVEGADAVDRRVAPDETHEEAAINIGELGTGLIEGNTTQGRKLYAGQKAGKLTIRNNSVGTSRREDDTGPA